MTRLFAYCALLCLCLAGQLQAAPTLNTKAEFFSGEPVVIEFAGLPGNQKDWIVISKPTDTAFRPGNKRKYTRGKQNGSLEFSPQPAGEYEARLYLNYPIGGYKIHAKVPFKVSRKSKAKTGGEVQEQTEGEGATTLPTIDGMQGNTSGLASLGGAAEGEAGADGAAAPEPPKPPTVGTSKKTYMLNEPVVVTFEGLPGNPEDFITIPRPKAHKTYMPSAWAYSEGKKEGELTFHHFETGEWEVRLYFETTGWNIQHRHLFEVIEPEATIKASKELYSTEEDITLTYENLPGYKRDWISVIAAGKGDHLYDKTGVYTAETEGATSGEMTFPKLKSGEYEARIYFNYPAGGYHVKARAKFEVLDPDELEEEEDEEDDEEEDEDEDEDEEDEDEDEDDKEDD